MIEWSARWIAPVEGEDLPARQRPAPSSPVAALDGEVAPRRCTPPPTASTRRSSTAPGRRHRADPGLHRLPVASAGPLVRRDRPARRRRQRHRRAAQRRLVARPEQRRPPRRRLRHHHRTSSCSSTSPPPTAAPRPSGPTRPGARHRATSCGPTSSPARSTTSAGGADWNDRSAWAPVRVEDHGFERLVVADAPPVRQIEELRPSSVRGSPPAAGSSTSARTSAAGSASPARSAGTEVTLTYGEWLDHDGDVTQEHLYARSIQTDADLPFQTDVVVSAGSTATVRAAAQHQGLPVRPHRRRPRRSRPPTTSPRSSCTPTCDASAASSAPTSASTRSTASRDWSFRDNACDIPTDCPTRERAGWTGDWQIFVETAAFLYDVAGFNRSGCATSPPSSDPTAGSPTSSPSRTPATTGHRILAAHRGLAGWGDAAVHVPWVQHRMTGDTDILAEQYASARRWVDYAAGRPQAGRHPDRAARSAEPLAHERYLWDSGWHYGEWLEAGESLDQAIATALVADRGPVATAYLHRSAARARRDRPHPRPRRRRRTLRRARRERRRRLAHRVPRRRRPHHPRHAGHLRPRARLRAHPRSSA